MTIMKNWNRVQNQFVATILANIITIAQGVCLGWLSPALLILESDQSPVGPITLDELTWIGSLLLIGAVAGSLIFGVILQYAGSKYTLLSIASTNAASWLLILFATKPWQLYIARFIAGLGNGASFVIMPSYVSEISDIHVRGALGSLLMSSFNAGVLVAFIGGTFMSYDTVPKVYLIFPLLFIIGFGLMPNTPQYFLKNGQITEARKSLQYYRNLKPTNVEQIDEIECELERLKVINKAQMEEHKFRLTDFYNKQAIKGLFVALVLVLFMAFSGSYAILNYATRIFQESGSDMDPNISGILLGAIQVIGTYSSTFLIDRVGRRLLLLVSFSGNAIGLGVLSIFTYLQYAGHNLGSFNLMPVISLSFSIFITNIGIFPIPFVTAFEVFAPKIRKGGLTIVTFFSCLFSFTALKVFPLLTDILEFYTCMWMFAIVNVVGIVFCIFIVPETKGKSIDFCEFPMKPKEQLCENENL